MLEIKESAPSETRHSFQLTEVGTDQEITFTLTSDTYPDVTIDFPLASPKFRIHRGYTVSVHLFKNAFFTQNDVFNLRINGLQANQGRAGYFFRLDALFEQNALQLNRHNYSYAYYAVEHLLSAGTHFQSKEYELTSVPPEITDFFDEDTIVLVLCNEHCNGIAHFSIDNYLPQLYLNGFIPFDRSTSIAVFNDSALIEDNFNEAKKIPDSNGDSVLRIEAANAELTRETFTTYLFRNLIQKNNEPVTRFILLYQVIEILISRVLHLEIQEQVCNNITSLTGFALKNLLSDVQKESNRIKWLMNVYARPEAALEKALKDALLSFFMHVQDPDYINQNGKETLPERFYDYRNKMVHNYRQIHAPGIDATVTEEKMRTINLLTEILIAHSIINFKTTN